MIGNNLNDEDKCQEFDTKVRSNGTLWDFGDPECQEGENSSNSKIEYDTSFNVFGINLVVPRLNFSINVYTSVDTIEGFQDAEFSMTYFTISFGGWWVNTHNSF